MNARIVCAIALIGLVTGLSTSAYGTGRDVLSDTWVATDALGREVPTYEEVGPPREDKVIALFYFTWLGQHSMTGPFNIPEILAADPDDPPWGPEQHFHHWGEPEHGYYLSDDEYVIRHHAKTLTDAGVDVLFMDVTNAFTYRNVYMKICEVFQDIRDNGGRTPQIGFLAHAFSDRVVRELYDDFYSQGLYPELWFMWEGKPLILAMPEEEDPEIEDFFTIRRSWAWSAAPWFGDGYNAWPWLDHTPQQYGWVEEGVPEQLPVAVAQHATTNIGRSHHDGQQPPPEEQRPELGLYFQEQWERALEVDPQVVFITGWNEWVAQRFISDGTATLAGETVPPGGSYFVDAYTQEYNRDIEPMKGGHTDSTYYQMVSNIRRFRGARPQEPITRYHTIEIDGDFADWDAVAPTYFDTEGDTFHRDHPGWGEVGPYINTTGRNDFSELKVALDEEFVYFMAQCVEPITPHTDPNWMLLFINADRDASTGWEGYNYVVNRQVLDERNTVLRRSLGGWDWEDVGEIAYHVNEHRLELAIPRSMLPDLGEEFEFKWADNIQADDDITQFNVSGDAAPNGRFNYLIRLKIEDEPDDIAQAPFSCIR